MTNARPRAGLSVVVTAYGSMAALERCLTALVVQPEAADIIVADCSPDDPSARVARQFANVRVLHVAERRTVPSLRWTAVRAARLPVIAVTEARMVPDPDWCAVLADAHARWPDAPVVGGSVGLAGGASARDWALYLCEYAPFAPPLEPQEAQHLSSANVSYKREALAASREELDAGRWETGLHERWRAEGHRLRLCPAGVTYQGAVGGGLGRLPALAMRFFYARDYAADRARRWSLSRRLVYGAASPALAVVLLWRLARVIHRRHLAGPTGRAAGWIVAFTLAWSFGEGCGYLVGPNRTAHIY